MARVQMPLGLIGSDDLPRTKKVLQNCFNTLNGWILSRPGIDGLNTTGTTARGNFTFNGSMYQVTGNRLIKITSKATGAFSVVDTIEGSAAVKVAEGTNHMAIVVPGGKTYSLDKSDVVADLSSNSNFVPFADVTHHDSRFYFVPADGSAVRFTDVGDITTIAGLSFFAPEELPDGTNGIFNLANTLLIAGPQSIEHYTTTGGFPIPVTRINGARLLNGYIGGFIEYEGSAYFIGRAHKQDFGIYRTAQGQAQKVSNEPIDRILKTYSLSELAEVVTARVNWVGYPLLSFALRRHSFAWYRENWFLTDTVFDGVSRPWGAGFVTEFEGEYFTAFSDKIGKFSASNTDYGNPITRIIDTGFEHENNEPFSCGSVELGISQGFNTVNGTVGLRLSDDSVLYKEPLFRSLGKQGQYDKRLVWSYKGGLGYFDGYMGMRIQTTQDIKFSTDSMIVNF